MAAVLAGCGAESGSPAVPSTTVQALDLSQAAREAAVIDAASLRFKQSVQDPFLARGMTVRGLTRAVGQKSSLTQSTGPATLHPAKYNARSGSCAKLEVVEGKVLYTAIARSIADGAAVLQAPPGSPSWVVSYEVEAEVTPDGELTHFVFRQLGEAKQALPGENDTGQCHG